MNTRNLLSRVIMRPELLLLAATVLGCHTSSANELRHSSYSMAVFNDESYGKDLIAGNYERVIADHGHKQDRRADGFLVNNNLCVAYFLAQDVENAKASCNKAVDLSRNRLRRNRGDYVSSYKQNLAMALTNRGVVLALDGNTTDAKRDFKEAIRMRARVSASAENLARLEEKRQAAHASL